MNVGLRTSCRHGDCLQAQTEAQHRYERERRELDQSHASLTKQLESKLCDYETVNKVIVIDCRV